MSPAVETVKVILLKPFVFSYSARKGEKMPQELKFAPRIDPEAERRGDPFKWLPTEVDIPRFVAEHPWVKDDFADGAIEAPEVTRKRLKAAADAQAEERRKNAKIIRQAEDAYRRTAAGAKVAAAQGKRVEGELDTPVNELGRIQGEDIDPGLERELNTPVGELQQRQEEESSTAERVETTEE